MNLDANNRMVLRLRRIRPLAVVFAFVGFALIVVGIILWQGARAQDVADTRSISISPLTFEFRVDPGQVVTDQIRVFNSGTNPAFVSVKIEDTSPTGERGQAIISEAGTTTYSVAEWTVADADVVEVQPGEQRAISFTLTIPETAEPGGHYGAITVENTPGPTAGTGIVFAQKVAALMLVDVAGDVFEEVTLTDFFISQEKTRIRFDWIPTNWILDPSEITFVTRFENTGSVHAKPAGFITVTNALGNELAKLPLDQRNVLPDSARVLEMEWTPGGLEFGKIRAQVDAIYGKSNSALFAAQEFWLIPVTTLAPWVIGGVIGLLLVLILRKRLWAALKIIIRGDASADASRRKEKGERRKSEDESEKDGPTSGTSEVKPRSNKPPGDRPTVT